MQAHGRRLDAALAAALFLAALAWFRLTLDRDFGMRDEGMLYRFAARVAAGEVPHRDFTDVYGPATHLLTALGVRLFDGEILAVRWMLACLKASAVVLAFGIARFAVPRPAALFTSLLAIGYWGRPSFNLNFPYAALYTVPLCMASLWLLLRALARDSRAGFGAAGLAAGAALLFKQSLGVFDLYGLVLALCALSALEAASRRGSPTRTAVAALLWSAAALVPLVGLRELLDPREYALHFLALHLAMLGVAAGVLARGDLGPLRASFERRVLPFALGAALPPLATALLYLAWGALGSLWFDMFVLPRQLRNYAVPAGVPPLGLSLVLAGGVGLISAALFGLAGLRRRAGVLGALSLAIAATGRALPVGEATPLDVVGFSESGLFSPPILWQAADFFTGVQGALLALPALAFLARALLRPGGADGGELRVVLPILFFHITVSLQSFPRASYNTWLVQGAFAPLLAWLLFRWHRWAGATTRPRRWLAAGLVALLPLWALGPLVQRAWVVGPWELPRGPVGLPRTAGIAVGGPFRSEWLPGVRAVVPELLRAEPADAPLFVLGNEEMFYYVSGRRPLFPEREYALFLLGWDMLPVSRIEALDAAAMVERLREHPDAILVERVGDPATLRVRSALPELADFVDRELEPVRSFGSYRVLRSRAR